MWFYSESGNEYSMCMLSSVASKSNPSLVIGNASVSWWTSRLRQTPIFRPPGSKVRTDRWYSHGKVGQLDL